jgi:hypothetical protein
MIAVYNIIINIVYILSRGTYCIYCIYIFTYIYFENNLRSSMFPATLHLSLRLLFITTACMCKNKTIIHINQYACLATTSIYIYITVSLINTICDNNISSSSFNRLTHNFHLFKMYWAAEMPFSAAIFTLCYTAFIALPKFLETL